MSFLYMGIQRLLDWTYSVCGDYGIAIVLITIGIRLAVSADMTTLLLPWVPSLLDRDQTFILPMITVMVQTAPQLLPYLRFFEDLKLPKSQLSMLVMMTVLNGWFAFLLPAGVELYYLVSGLFTSIEQAVGYALEARRLQTV